MDLPAEAGSDELHLLTFVSQCLPGIMIKGKGEWM